MIRPFVVFQSEGERWPDCGGQRLYLVGFGRNPIPFASVHVTTGPLTRPVYPFGDGTYRIIVPEPVRRKFLLVIVPALLGTPWTGGACRVLVSPLVGPSRWQRFLRWLGFNPIAGYFEGALVGVVSDLAT